MQLMDKDTSIEFQRLRYDFNQINIDDIDEHRKRNEIDREYNALFTSFTLHLDNIGYLLEAGLVDPEMIYKFGAGGWGPINTWDKWRSYVLVVREEWGVPDYMMGFEFYADSMRKLREQKGYSSRFEKITSESNR
jgi:hypothetical protein